MYATHAGTRTIARQRWESNEAQRKAEQQRRNKEAHARVLASLPTAITGKIGENS